MALKAQINGDLVQAMKSKNEVAVSALRMLKAAILKFEVSGSGKKEATDEEVLTMVGKEVKQRKDSISEFKKGGREDLAQKEAAEMAYLEKYLPKQLNEEEVKAIVTAAKQEVGATSKVDFGKLMGAVMPKVKGKADGALVGKVVKEVLG